MKAPTTHHPMSASDQPSPALRSVRQPPKDARHALPQQDGRTSRDGENSYYASRWDAPPPVCPL
ncbi:hypothetical protein E2C01_079764 [Portunus trituberculatus]|uniref:Uncharacterized protein n=1 Tax=Portunus trituberculatus TaxID=210409 RepID=A0A5B7ITN4_PORTR|nr:hypothetical protein [Portunus trituberculatus]